MEVLLSFFVCLKTHLNIENRLSACFKTDFTASHFLQVILSVAALLYEITLSKFSREIKLYSDAESELTKKFNFTYKCTDRAIAMNQLELLQGNLLREDGLNVLFLDAKQIPSDNDTNINFIVIFFSNSCC